MILFDTGVLVGAARADDDDHVACARLLRSVPANERLVPATVIAETAYLLQTKGSPDAEARFLEDLAAGDLHLAELSRPDLIRTAELTRRYLDMPLGATDASIIALAERLEIDTIATLDRRHFTVVRPRHVGAFTLLP
ncbi:VapC toxin family PIN domain ribonuclease [Geodermatophilus sp. TF02-6]|uniref:type II toxin-antitoxin system VapC family toxin n=1 Tax=Geodermatophilus sp. TF02-6 TaxID=2250575 RepID=UPI000DEBEA0C|nr:PIN domain-containing protein [Geodermatophilus sp. TF02-6]RBY76105.1 VapC toxin family PIN domain ribonuclease [Geodermatophilus sp. TF02-6]